MIKEFSPAELAEMRADLDRNPGAHGLSVVAQLHACKKEDVITALGLDPDDYARKPQVKVSPKQKADAVERAAKGEPLKSIAEDLDVLPITVSRWVREAKANQLTEVPQTPERTNDTPLAQRPAVKLSAVAESYYDDLRTVISYMEQTELLSDADAELLNRMTERLWAFSQGIIWAEEHAERSAEWHSIRPSTAPFLP